MNWTPRELDLIEKLRPEIESDPEKFLEKHLKQTLMGDFRGSTKIILAICLLLEKPIFLKVNKNLEIESSIKVNGQSLIIMYTEMDEEAGFKEIQKWFLEDLMGYYHISEKTAERICKLTRRGE